MAFTSHKQSSRIEWGIREGEPTLEQLSFGAMQRIADSTEIMAQEYKRLIDQRNLYERLYKSECVTTKKMANRIRGLQGTVTRMKKHPRK